MKITILGMWCTNSNCKFIDKKHIQIELTVNIWYSYDNDSKTDVIDKEFCFVKEIDFNELNDTVEILEEEKKIPKKTKIELLEESDNWCIYNGDYHITDYKINPEILDKINSNNTKIQKKLDEIIDYLKSKGDE